METVTSLSALFERTIARKRRELRSVLESAPEIVIFGSTAAGLRRRDSDVDVLCTGEETSHFKDRDLDLLVLSPRDAFMPQWYHGELASHITAYGVWLTRPAAWVDRVSLTEIAARSKVARLNAYANALKTHWDRLGDQFKQKYVIKLRREMQRLQLLKQGIAIPPTIILDRSWTSDLHEHARVSVALERALAAIGSEKLEEFQRRLESKMDFRRDSLASRSLDGSKAGAA